MTSIYAERDGRGRYSVSARGHASGAPAACAGISAILFALAGALRDGRFGRTETLRLEKADALLRFSGGDRAGAAWDMTVIGLRLIAEKYPEQVRLEIKNTRPCKGDGGRRFRPERSFIP